MSTFRHNALLAIAAVAFAGAAIAAEAATAPEQGANTQMAPQGDKAAPSAVFARVEAAQLADKARLTGNAALMASAAAALRDAQPMAGAGTMTFTETGGIDDGSVKTETAPVTPASLFNEARKMAGDDASLKSFIDAEEQKAN
jgi:hypothetical protein